jgi:hypothetical protein
VAGLLAIFERRRLLRVFGAVESAVRWLEAEHALERGELLSAYRRATEHLEL